MRQRFLVIDHRAEIMAGLVAEFVGGPVLLSKRQGQRGQTTGFAVWATCLSGAAPLTVVV